MYVWVGVYVFVFKGVPVVFQVALGLLKVIHFKVFNQPQLFLILCDIYYQAKQHDFLNLDFEGILNYFRASLPKKFGSEEEAKSLFRIVNSFNKVKHIHV